MPRLCPHLPAPRPEMDWRSLNAFGRGDRGEAFYRSCLEYGQLLWTKGLVSRAILCLDRAMGADLTGGEEVLRRWPVPYEAMGWFLSHTPPEGFVGNPRVHFQHYADRMNEPRKAQRSWRAWACWALAVRLQPSLPGDPRHTVREPAIAEISRGLALHGIAGEEALWSRVLGAGTGAPHSPEAAAWSRESGETGGT